jgi:hypothetical protein
MTRLKIAQVLTAAGLLFAACHSLPQAQRGMVTIHAIGPTGNTFYTPHPHPIWSFDITNRGPSAIYWEAGVEVEGEHTNYSHAGGHIDWPEGILPPASGLQTNMIIPAGRSWRGWVDYAPHLADQRRRYNDQWQCGCPSP